MTQYEILKKLQEIQANNIGVIDCNIETRKDHQCTQIIFKVCDYLFDKNGKIDDKNKSKLYIHRFKWTNPDYTYELKLIDDEIEMLKDIYK